LLFSIRFSRHKNNQGKKEAACIKLKWEICKTKKLLKEKTILPKRLEQLEIECFFKKKKQPKEDVKKITI
jgi:hypothetical protein